MDVYSSSMVNKDQFKKSSEPISILTNCKSSDNILNSKNIQNVGSFPDRPTECIKPAKTVDTLDELIRELHRIFESDHIDVEYVSQLMLSYKSNPAEWKKFAKYDRFRYTRNLVDSGNGKFNLMVLCWGEGHASPIHDHADAHCFMKMLKGELEEIRYAWPQMHDPIIKNKMPDLDVCCDQNGGYQNGVGTGNLNSNFETSCRIGGENGSSCEHEPDSNDNVVDCEDHQMIELGRTRLETNGVCYINDSLGLHRVENPSHVDSAVSLHLYCPPFDACHVFNQQTGLKTKSQVTFWSKYGQKRNREIQESRAPEDN